MRRPIIALMVTTVLSMLATSERFIGLTYFLYLLEYYFLYWLTYNMVQSEEDFRRIVRLLLVAIAMQSVIYFIQSGLGVTFDLVGQTWEEGDISRPGGTVSTNPAGFASFIMPPLFMAIAIAIVKARVWPRGYAVLVSLMGIAALVLTFTRGAWSGFALGMIVVAIMGVRSRAIPGKTVLLGTAAAVIGGLMLLPVMLARVAGDYSGEGGSTTSGLDERLGLIQIALNIVAEHPVTGIGPGSYGYLFKSHLPGGMDQWLFVVHNEFLLRAAEIGIPGALAFVFFLIVGFKVALRLARTGQTLIGVCALGWFGALIALVWQMNWVPWIGWSYNAMLWVMLGLMDAAQRLVVHDGNRTGLN
jgi:putative inorganic carbon (HCO3(-)) transporter